MDKELAEKIERINSTLGKVANAICALSLYDSMEKDDRESMEKIKIDFASFTGEVRQWMSTTTEYRQSLCKKVDTINDYLSKLPCSERKGWYQSMSRQMVFMWGALSTLALVWLKHVFVK